MPESQIYPIGLDFNDGIKMLNGSVKWFNDGKGYGFIHSEGKDYFVHYKAIKGSDSFKSLKEGDAVQFLADTSPKGLVAKDVTKV